MTKILLNDKEYIHNVISKIIHYMMRIEYYNNSRYAIVKNL